MVAYGEGNSCYRESSSLDNVAHEIGHGICYFTSDLFYAGDAGAINESFSDIWGAVIENWAAPSSPPKQKWKIGEEFTLVSPGYIRDMANPSAPNNPSCYIYSQPDTYNSPGYIPGNGVHINSGIMNYWFYLLTDGSGGNKTNDVGNIFNVTGIGITKSAKIAYETEKSNLSYYADFFEARAVSIWKARQIYGNGCKGSAEEIAVTKAWYAVNVGPDYNSNPPYTLIGDASACNQYQCNTYSLTGVPPDATINWTLTQTPNNTVSGVNNGNGTYTICRNNNTNGFVTITAQIVFGQCTTAVSKSINVGMPYVLFPSNPPQYPGALIYDYDNDENCNYTCYHPSIYRNFSISDPYNGTVTWQKVSSYPANVAWNTSNNTISVLLKAVNQTITLKRTITNPCNTANPLVEYYCFRASGSLCSSLRSSTPPIAQQLKVYPNPTSINNALTLELTSDKGEVIDFENSSIQLVDAQNLIVVQKSGSKIAKEKLEIPALSKGVYYIKVTNKNGVSTQQLMINN